MRRSRLYETIIKELENQNLLNSKFNRRDLSELNKSHQKYLAFIYKHSDLKNKGKMTLYFLRHGRKDGLINFSIDKTVFKKYTTLHH